MWKYRGIMLANRQDLERKVHHKLIIGVVHLKVIQWHVIETSTNSTVKRPKLCSNSLPTV